MGESVTVSLSPDYSQDGEILEYGRVSVEGDLQTLFFQYGNIAALEEEFTQLIKEAELLLPKLAEKSQEERLHLIDVIFAIWEEA